MTTIIAAAEVMDSPGNNAVVVNEGRITAVGPLSELDQPGFDRFVRSSGVVLTGLRDAHIHPSGYASAVTGFSVHEAKSFDDLRRRVFARALELRPGVPVVGVRLDENGLSEQRLPTRRDLDELVENRPIVLTRYCGHVAVGSTEALKRAGIGVGTPDPPGGTIDRDSAGIATGVLRETAVALLSATMAGEASVIGPERLLKAISGLAGLGITRADAIVSTGTAIWCGTEGELEDLLEIAPDLPIELSVFVTAGSPSELERAAQRLTDSRGPVSWAGLKVFADGSLGGHTAAMEAPYADHTTTGTMRLQPIRDATLAEAALDMGGTVAIHAIGDRANRVVLDLFRSLKGGWADHSRFRVEHASVLSEDLIARYADLGVTASVQPAFIRTELDWLATRLGPERVRWTYPLRSLLAAGVPMVAGSDTPVEDPNPWPAILAATNNLLTPSESLGRRQALAIFGGRTPVVGDRADVIVVDRDPLTTSDVAATRVVATFVAGRPVSAEPILWPG